MIRPITKSVRLTANSGIIHDSRGDVKRLAAYINELADKLNEVIDKVNELDKHTSFGGNL